MRQTDKSYNASTIERIAITEHYAPMIMAPSSKIFKNNKTQKYSYLYYMFNVHACMHVRMRACMLMYTHTHICIHQPHIRYQFHPSDSKHTCTNINIYEHCSHTFMPIHTRLKPKKNKTNTKHTINEHTQMHIYTHTHTHTHKYTYINK